MPIPVFNATRLFCVFFTLPLSYLWSLKSKLRTLGSELSGLYGWGTPKNSERTNSNWSLEKTAWGNIKVDNLHRCGTLKNKYFRWVPLGIARCPRGNCGLPSHHFPLMRYLLVNRFESLRIAHALSGPQSVDLLLNLALKTNSLPNIMTVLSQIAQRFSASLFKNSLRVCSPKHLGYFKLFLQFIAMCP